MKKSIYLALLLLSMNSFSMISLLCGQQNNTGYNKWDQDNKQVVFKDIAEFECLRLVPDVNSNTGFRETARYDVVIKGKGLGLKYTHTEGMTLICPTVRKKAMGVETFENRLGKTKKGTTVFKGLKVSAGLILGADAAVLANKRAGTCFLGGISVGTAGAGISGVTMTITQ